MRKLDLSRLKTTEPVSSNVLSFFSSTLTYANSSANGLVRIVDSTSNTSATIAASANSVKVAFDLATTANSGLAAAYSNAVAYTDAKVANLVNTAPAALDTLTELASALGNDANFSTTVLTGIANAYTNALASAASLYLPLSGGEVTGNVAMSGSRLSINSNTIFSNGRTVTALTRTAGGSGYTSFPSVTISAPTAAGGVQATASVVRMFNSIATVAGGGTGYSVGDTLTIVGGTPNSTAATYTVATVSGGVITSVTAVSVAYTSLPTNPVSVTGGTGTGATLNLTWAVDPGGLSITNAGSGYVDQPTVSFSGGGGGTGAAAYATVGSNTTVKSIGSAISFTTPSGEQFRVIDNTTTAVNYVQVKGSGSGSFVSVSAQGSDGGVSLGLVSKGVGGVTFYTNGGNQTQMAVTHTANAVNYVQVTGATTSASPTITFIGADAGVGGIISSKGNGGVSIFNNSSASRQLRIGAGGVTAAANWLTIDGSIASNSPRIGVDGSDTNIDLTLTPKGTGQTNIGTNFANYLALSGAPTTKTVEAKALGSDTNIAFTIDSKGTGAVNLAGGSGGVNISNGGTVTAITRTASGSGYTSLPTVTISAPTTANGVQATATCTLGISSATIGAGGTGYTLNDVITVSGGTTGAAAVCTVTGVTSGVVTAVTFTSFGTYTVLPTNAAATTGGTGTGLTLNLGGVFVNTGFTITNAGSGYVEQPTVTFSGGGGSGAAAYATVGSVTTIRSLGSGTTGITKSSLQFVTPNSTSANHPPLAIRDIENSDSGIVISPATGYVQIFASHASSSHLMLGSAGTSSIYFNTQGASQVNQMRVSHTANAVNYTQITGANTGNNPTISAQGTDTNIGLSFVTKGSFGMQFNNASGGSIVQYTQNGSVSATTNFLRFTNFNGTGGTPAISAQGSDTNIDLSLTPKGTGIIRANGDTTITGTANVSVGINTPGTLSANVISVSNVSVTQQNLQVDAAGTATAMAIVFGG